jgi:two-component system phosphate regulon sensor histidine kinase PhoR
MRPARDRNLDLRSPPSGAGAHPAVDVHSIAGQPAEGTGQLEMILNGLVEGVVAVDLDERVIHLNSAAGRLLRVRRSESLGKRLSELTSLTNLSSTVSRALETRCEATAEAVIEMPSNERNQVLEFEASPVRDGTGRVSGAVLSIHDITELRHLEHVRRDFVANVSHELKTPITAIRGLIETILTDREMPDPTRRRFLEKVHSQALRLSTLVTDLLTLARLESRDAILEPIPFDLREPILTSIRASRSTEDRTARVEHELADHPVLIRGDPESMRLVASNLLDNALKYTPTAGRIQVRLFIRGSQAIFEVEDNGIGIEPKDRQRIFERFYRVDKARSRELGGTGLGLSIVKHVCLAHGGLVDVESAPGKGSLFRVTLPLAEAYRE